VEQHETPARTHRDSVYDASARRPGTARMEAFDLEATHDCRNNRCRRHGYPSSRPSRGSGGAWSAIKSTTPPKRSMIAWRRWAVPRPLKSSPAILCLRTLCQGSCADCLSSRLAGYAIALVPEFGGVQDPAACHARPPEGHAGGSCAASPVNSDHRGSAYFSSWGVSRQPPPLPLLDGIGKATLMQALYLCGDGFMRVAQELDGR
jgi:hypothetical protein